MGAWGSGQPLWPRRAGVSLLPRLPRLPLHAGLPVGTLGASKADSADGAVFPAGARIAAGARRADQTSRARFTLFSGGTCGTRGAQGAGQTSGSVVPRCAFRALLADAAPVALGARRPGNPALPGHALQAWGARVPGGARWSRAALGAVGAVPAGHPLLAGQPCDSGLSALPRVPALPSRSQWAHGPWFARNSLIAWLSTFPGRPWGAGKPLEAGGARGALLASLPSEARGAHGPGGADLSVLPRRAPLSGDTGIPCFPRLAGISTAPLGAGQPHGPGLPPDSHGAGGPRAAVLPRSAQRSELPFRTLHPRIACQTPRAWQPWFAGASWVPLPAFRSRGAHRTPLSLRPLGSR